MSLVPEDDIFAALEPQVALVEGLAARVEPSRETFAYAPGKWSVRELLGHVTDAERVFAYRALTFSRFDAVSLPGFDEVTWTPHGHFADVPLRRLADEFVLLQARQPRDAAPARRRAVAGRRQSRQQADHRPRARVRDGRPRAAPPSDPP